MIGSAETPQRIEPTSLEVISEQLADTLAEITKNAEQLARALHPSTATGLVELLRLTNSYYSNLIEGNATRPHDIERALAAQLHHDRRARDLQREAAAHVRVQRQIDARYAHGQLGEPASIEFVRWLHRAFYEDAPEAMLRIETPNGESYAMVPGELRSEPRHDNVVGRHHPPASNHVANFMLYFEQRFRMSGAGSARRIIQIAVAHHRLNFIHPFPDGNGRVSRLMSHAMVQQAGIGAHGLWSISRGLSRGLVGRPPYKAMMEAADAPCAGDLDGRGNLSLAALASYTQWFCDVMLDQMIFMRAALKLDSLRGRLATYVERDLGLSRAAAAIAGDVLVRGEIPRGDAARITGLRERAARESLAQLTDAGLLTSTTPKGPVSLHVSAIAAEALFPRLF